MTAGQASAYQSMMPDYGLTFSEQSINFSELFGNDNPVVLEIGFGMGKSLIEQALMYPERNYLGIEVHRPGVGALLARMIETGATNIRVISHDAIEILEHMIPNDTLTLVQLYFPDPWHKTRHHKRRIVQPSFVSRIADKLREGGHLHMATDWQNYAQHMLKTMLASPDFTNCSKTNDYIPKPDDRPVTKFQKRGERLGHGVWDLMFERNDK